MRRTGLNSRLLPALAFFAAFVVALLANESVSSENDSEPEYKRADLPPVAIKLKVMGEPQRVISAEDHRCPGLDEWGGKMDLPDAPLRAFRKASGAPVVIAAHYNNLVYSTMDFSSLTRATCQPIYSSRKDADPSHFADRSWLVSTAVLPSGAIFGLVHNEYWGGLHNLLCGARLGRRLYWDSVCLYVNLTAAISEDDGRTFIPLRGEQGVVAAYPYGFSVSMNRNGVRDPTNIVLNPEDGYYYFAAIVDAMKEQKRGMCIFRSREPRIEPWKAWGGQTFNARLSSPYGKTQDDSVATCAPVSGLDFTTLVYSRTHRVFIGFGREERLTPGGAFYRTSPDLVHWSKPAFLLEGHGFGFWVYGKRMMEYPSLLDPDDASRNFDGVGNAFFLYYESVRYSSDGKLDGRSRDIYRVPVGLQEP